MSGLLVIPARWGSTRLPGKPLIPIAGKPLLARVVDVARRALDDLADVDLVVATDNERIAAFAAGLGCEIVMTDAALSSGSARALAAAEQRRVPPTTVVNIQGDAPFMPPGAILSVMDALGRGAAVATPVHRLSWNELDALRHHKMVAPFSGTTCVVTGDGTAAWFSKQIIPAIRDEDGLRAAGSSSPVLQHLGLYGYTLDALRRFEASPPGRYEAIEGLEQLRFLDLGIPIQTVTIDAPRFILGGIDTQADVIRAERIIAAVGDHQSP